MAVPVAILDACVLYSAPLRDLLIRLSRAGLYGARWTNEIHDEWIGHLLANRPDLNPEHLARTRTLMNQAVRGCLVTGHEPLIGGLMLPDLDDRHVLAAAIYAKAEVIVTYNCRDFPEDYLAQFRIAVQHPDEFISSQFDLSSSVFCQAVKQHRADLKSPPKSVEEYLQTLQNQQLVQTVNRLRAFAALL